MDNKEISSINLSPRFETLSTYTVIKRDGREEPFYLDKLIKVIKWASETTSNPNIFIEQLLNELSLKIVNKMHISDLYDEAINICVGKISAIQPQWDDIAKYLYLLKIYKEQFRLKRIGSYPSITKFIERGVKKLVYDPKLFESFTTEELDDIDNMIDPNRDLIFNYKGLRLFFDKYCKNSHGKTKTKKVELPQITFMIAAIHSHYNEPHDTKEERKKRLKNIQITYDFLSNHEVTFATPMISNAGKKNSQFASCVLITVDDDTYSIVYSVGWCALYSKFKGGIAFDVSYIRASGSSILSNDGYSDGPIPFIKMVEQTVSSFNQGGCCGSNTLVTVIKNVELTNGEVYQFRKPKIECERIINKEMMDFIEENLIDIRLRGLTITKDQLRKIWIDKCLQKRREDIVAEIPGLTIDIYKRHIASYINSLDKTKIKNFKIIPFAKDFLIHPDGTIIGLKRMEVLKPFTNRKGYVCVNILSRKNSMTLHRVLYLVFKGEIPPTYTIDHIDGNKTNNSLDNLQLMTREENFEKWLKESKLFNTMDNYREARIKRCLNYNHRLVGYRTNDEIEIKKINTIQVLLSEVKVGDYVKSFNVHTQQIEFKRVDETFKFDIDLDRQYLLEFDNGSKVVTSDHHPIFYSINGKIRHKRTDEMQIGDLCISSNSENINTKLVKISKLDKKQKFYDLTVSGNNNYFAVDSTSENNKNEVLIHNTRSGAAIIYFQWWNWDVFNLLTLKDAGGAEELRARKCKYGMKINQLFLERVKNDEYVTLFDAKETRILNELYGEEFEKKYIEFENDVNIRSKKVKAREIMYDFFKARTETGNVYLAHMDNINHQNVTNRLVSMSNLCCFGGSEKALIKENDEIKEVELEKLEGQIKEVWNGYEWSEAKFRKYSDNDLLLLARFKKYYNNPFSNKQEFFGYIDLRVTGDHKWKVKLVSKSYRKCIEIETLTTKEIKNLLENADFFTIEKIEVFRHNSPTNNDRIDEWMYEFDEIIDDNFKGPTYCCEESKLHMFVVNGIYTHNCEITVPSRPPRIKKETFYTTNNNKKEVITVKTGGEIGLCNLSSINSLKWFNMNSEKKDRLIETLLRGFDNKIDSQYYPVAEAEWPNKAYRPIGIGVTDIANLLASEKLLYSNPESLQFINDLYDDIYYRIYYQSMLLAKEKGFYEGFRESNWAKGLTPYHLSLYRKNNHLGIEFKNDKKWDKLGETISQIGVRFSLHATLPPSACQLIDDAIYTNNGKMSLKDFIINNNLMTEEEINTIMLNGVVKSFDVSDKNVYIPTRFGSKRVNKIFFNGYRKTRTLTFEDGNKYTFTYNHPVLLKTGEWKVVGDLQIGDDIETSSIIE